MTSRESQDSRNVQNYSRDKRFVLQIYTLRLWPIFTNKLSWSFDYKFHNFPKDSKWVERVVIYFWFMIQFQAQHIYGNVSNEVRTDHTDHPYKSGTDCPTEVPSTSHETRIVLWCCAKKIYWNLMKIMEIRAEKYTKTWL